MKYSHGKTYCLPQSQQPTDCNPCHLRESTESVHCPNRGVDLPGWLLSLKRWWLIDGYYKADQSWLSDAKLMVFQWFIAGEIFDGWVSCLVPPVGKHWYDEQIPFPEFRWPTFQHHPRIRMSGSSCMHYCRDVWKRRLSFSSWFRVIPVLRWCPRLSQSMTFKSPIMIAITSITILTRLINPSQSSFTCNNHQ